MALKPGSEIKFPIFQLEHYDFERLAVEVFEFQYRENPLYHSYVDSLKLDVRRIQLVTDIPFLPISFFKSHRVHTTNFDPECVFQSSGTTNAAVSHHDIKSLALYRQSFTSGFERFYGPISNYCILGLLPSYLEREGSSLVYMVNHLIQKSGHPSSGFYLQDYSRLAEVLQHLESLGQPTLLIGVTYALLDFAEKFPMRLRHTLVMETGGMKGRRREMPRIEVHETLKERFALSSIHSEYGMTELLSQAYSKADGIFETVPWMKVFCRNEYDPLSVFNQGEGVLNIIDLANYFSCSFLGTDDIGRIYSDGRFEVAGRLDASDLRGCNLLVN